MLLIVKGFSVISQEFHWEYFQHSEITPHNTGINHHPKLQIIITSVTLSRNFGDTPLLFSVRLYSDTAHYILEIPVFGGMRDGARCVAEKPNSARFD